MLRIKEIHIRGIGPIEDLSLELNTSFNIICGQNGVGKTTIIDCCATSFGHDLGLNLKRSANVEEGGWDFSGVDNNCSLSRSFVTSSFLPGDSHVNVGFVEYSKDVLVLKTHRDIQYEWLSGVPRDPENNKLEIAGAVSIGLRNNKIKSWLVNRYLWSGHQDNLSENQLKNLEIAKSCFSLLQSDVTFKTIDNKNYHLILGTGQGDILLEYLSSGYK